MSDKDFVVYKSPEGQPLKFRREQIIAFHRYGEGSQVVLNDGARFILSEDVRTALNLWKGESE